MSENTKFHSGFITIVGRPNVGKSTLMNAMVGEKIAIVSSRPQTTRNRIMGVMTRPDWQIVFLDTPGIHTPRTKLGESMMQSVKDAMDGMDGVLVLVDGDERTGRVMGVYVSDDHTPAMLPVFAYGPGADKFCGTYMNTEIARRIKSLIK